MADPEACATDDEWMKEAGYLPRWSPLRIKSARIFNSVASDIAVSFVILFNLVVVVVETDSEAKGIDSKNDYWIYVSNTVLLAFYVFEVSLRIFTFRRWFFKSQINVLDLFIIVLDFVITLMEVFFGHLVSVSFLRLFRLTRLRRSVKVMMLSPELSLLLRSMADTGKTLVWGTLMILVMLLMWAILAVQWIHPTNQEVANLGTYHHCDRCVDAFGSVMQASLTFYQQFVVGDAWSEVSMPIIEHAPLAVVFFIGVHVSVSIGLMNLLLAVIVDRATAARTEDVKELVRSEQQNKAKLGKRLRTVFSEMDKDGSGCLTLEELKLGFRKNVEFSSILTAMDVEEGDLDIVYCILEGSEHEGVRYGRFVDELWKMKALDEHTMLVFIKYYVLDVRNKLLHEVSLLEELLHEKFGNMHDKLFGSTYDQSQKEDKDLQEMVHDSITLQSLQPANYGLAMPALDEQGIISALTACIAQELRPLQSFVRDTSAMLKQNGFHTPSPQRESPQEIFHCNQSRLVDMLDLYRQSGKRSLSHVSADVQDRAAIPKSTSADIDKLAALSSPTKEQPRSFDSSCVSSPTPNSYTSPPMTAFQDAPVPFEHPDPLNPFCDSLAALPVPQPPDMRDSVFKPEPERWDSTCVSTVASTPPKGYTSRPRSPFQADPMQLRESSLFTVKSLTASNCDVIG